jgi:hypothetical protein
MKLDIEHVERAIDCLIDDVFDRRGAMVESRRGRHNDCAHLRQLHEKAQMPEMHRRLAHEQDQSPPLLQYDVRCAQKKVVRKASRDTRNGLNRARRHDHSRGSE